MFSDSMVVILGVSGPSCQINFVCQAGHEGCKLLVSYWSGF